MNIDLGWQVWSRKPRAPDVSCREQSPRDAFPAGLLGWRSPSLLAAESGGVRHGTVLTIVDVSAERWDDLAELMGERGDSSRCWCQYYRGDEAYEHDSREGNRAAMRRQVTTASVPHGVLAYEDRCPVGWCAVAPRGDYPRLKRMRAAKTENEDGL